MKNVSQATIVHTIYFLMLKYLAFHVHVILSDPMGRVTFLAVNVIVLRVSPVQHVHIVNLAIMVNPVQNVCAIHEEQCQVVSVNRIVNAR